MGYLAKTIQSSVVENTALDFTSPLKNVILEAETAGLTYRHVYGMNKVSVTVGDEKLYTHLDRMGSIRTLTDSNGGVKSSTSYDAWGAPIASELFTINGREIDVLRNYTGHSYDDVLGMYFAQARLYDAANKRFTAVDPIAGAVVNPMTLVPYAYVLNNPQKYVDPMGMSPNVLAYFNKLGCNVKTVVNQAPALNAIVGTVGKVSNAIDTLPSWAKVTIGAVGVVGAVAITVATGGAAAPTLVPIFQEVAVSTGLGAVLGGGTNAVMTAIQGDDKDTILSSLATGAVNGGVDGFMVGGMFAAGGATLNAVKAARNAKVIARTNEAAKVAAEARERASISERVRRNIQSSVNGRNASNFGAYADKERAVLERVRDAGKLSNVEARQWYLNQETKIKSLIDTLKTLKQQAKQSV